MVRSPRGHVAALLGLGMLLLSGVASAQAAAGGAPAAAPGGGGDKKDGYGYEFTDDPLNAGGFGPNDATIRVRPGPVRTTLIRPRTSFVPEMLKSVENL
jgi:hypothetical protein